MNDQLLEEAVRLIEQPTPGGQEKAESANQPAQEASEAQKPNKDQERLAKSWAKLNEEKARLAKLKAELERTKAELEAKAAEIDAQDPAKKIEALTAAIQAYEADGRTDLAQAARLQLKAIEQQLEERKRQSSLNKILAEQKKLYAKLVDENPELADEESQLYKAFREVLEKKPVFSTYPEGVIDAFELAKTMLAASEAEQLRKELSDAKARLAELEKKLQPSPSGVTSTGSQAADITKEQLVAMVAEALSRGLL